MSSRIHSLAKKLKDSKAMTLAEVLIAMTIGVVIMVAIYALLGQNKRIYVAQSNIAEMQQNARIALDLMTREILMAGYDPFNPDYLVLRIPPILNPSSTGIRVLADLNQDGDFNDTNENILFDWDSSTNEITRDPGSGAKVISSNVTAFDIDYDHAATTLTSGAGPGSTTLAVESSAGFVLGDWVYISDGVTLNNAFVTAIPSTTTLRIDPPLTSNFAYDSTVAFVKKITITLTAQTAERDPQTGHFRTIDLVSDIALRNLSN